MNIFCVTSIVVPVNDQFYSVVVLNFISFSSQSHRQFFFSPLVAKLCQFFSKQRKFLVVSRLTVNPIETLLRVFLLKMCHPLLASSLFSLLFVLLQTNFVCGRVLQCDFSLTELSHRVIMNCLSQDHESLGLREVPPFQQNPSRELKKSVKKN